MLIIPIVIAFGFGFAIGLVFLGRREAMLAKKIQQLESENNELKIQYLQNCWDSSV